MELLSEMLLDASEVWYYQYIVVGRIFGGERTCQEFLLNK